MKVISVRLPDWMLDLMDDLVDLGIFISRAEVIRYGIRLVLKKYSKELEKKKLTPVDHIEAKLKRFGEYYGQE